MHSDQIIFLLFILQISWIISDKSDGSVIELNPGQNNENFDALDLKEGQSMQYEAYLIIKSVDYNQDFDKTIKIRANVSSTYLVSPIHSNINFISKLVKYLHISGLIFILH